MSNKKAVKAPVKQDAQMVTLSKHDGTKRDFDMKMALELLRMAQKCQTPTWHLSDSRYKFEKNEIVVITGTRSNQKSEESETA